MKTGLLITRSALYPSMGFDLVSGLNAAMKSNSVSDHQLEVVNIGVAADNDYIHSTCEKLLLNGTDVVIAYLNPRNVEAVHGLFAAANKLLIVLDSGFHYSRLQPYSHVIFLSLHGTLCSWLTSEWALAKGLRKFIYTSSFYDAGYRTANSFVTPLLKAGGEVLFNHITPLKRADFTIAPLIDFIQTQKPEAIVASFCGDMASDFLNALACQNLTIPVYTSSFMLEDVFASGLPILPFEMKGIVPWFKELDLPQNKKFMNELRSLEKKEGNIFSLLTWEAAILIIEQYKHNITSANNLHHFTFESPRGTICINQETHIGDSTCYPIELVQSKIQHTNEFTPDPETISSYYLNAKSFPEHADMWFNAYPCLID